MKKVIYLIVMMFAIVSITTNCTKKDDIKPDVKKDSIVVDKTYEQLYPDWRDLRWISTQDIKNGIITLDLPYTLNIRIVSNTITETTIDTVYHFNSMSLTTTQVTFKDSASIGKTIYDYIKPNDSTIIVIIKHYGGQMEYKLGIH